MFPYAYHKKKYLILQLRGVNNRRPLTIDHDIDLRFGFGADVVLAAFIGVVGFIRAALLLLELGELLVDVELVPRCIVVLNRCSIADKIYSLIICCLFLLLSFLCGLLLLLLYFFFKLFLDLLLFRPFLSQNLVLGLFLDFHLVLPVVQVCYI
jgi:hypothetical protein